MNYNNEKLNIKIENAGYFTIKEYIDYVELYSDDIKMFVIYTNSTVYAHNNSTVRAYDFSCIYRKSIYAKITVDNPFVKVFEQVFKVPKRMLVYKKLANNLIATLQLERGQIFQSQFQDKCRTDKALVVSIESIDGKVKYEKGFSQNNNSFIYEVGKIVSAKYDEDINECSTGIHFFLSRHSAERY